MEKDGRQRPIVMRRQRKKSRKSRCRALLSVVSILSHVAAIVGTIMAAVDALRHW